MLVCYYSSIELLFFPYLKLEVPMILIISTFAHHRPLITSGLLLLRIHRPSYDRYHGILWNLREDVVRR